jgi:hypothetical protein
MFDEGGVMVVLPDALFFWRARYILIFASLSSINSPETSTRAFFTVPVNLNGVG